MTAVRARRGERGFTLLELMVVVSIGSVLAVLLAPNLLEARRLANERKALETLRSIFDAQQNHLKKFDRYANGIAELVVAGLLREPFTTGGLGIQAAGAWEFQTRVPEPLAQNQRTQFRIGAQPAGASLEQRLRHGDRMYIMLETGMVYEHRRTQSCAFDHLESTLRVEPDSVFGLPIPPARYPPTENP